MDLMALLKQSVEDSGKGKRAAAPRGRGAAAKRRMPARKAARRTASRRSAKKSA